MAEVNNWDPLDIDSDEEALDEEDIPTSSFGPPGEDTPEESEIKPTLQQHKNNLMKNYKIELPLL